MPWLNYQKNGQYFSKSDISNPFKKIVSENKKAIQQITVKSPFKLII